MKLVGELKKKVEETKNKEEAKELIEKAGMQLTDEELDNVTGGCYTNSYERGECDECSWPLGVNGKCTNPDCPLSK